MSTCRTCTRGRHDLCTGLDGPITTHPDSLPLCTCKHTEPGDSSTAELMTRHKSPAADPWADADIDIVPPPKPLPAPCKVHEPVSSVEWHIKTAKNDRRQEGAYTVTRCAVCGVHLVGGAL